MNEERAAAADSESVVETREEQVTASGCAEAGREGEDAPAAAEERAREAAERAEDYFGQLQRLKADFDNYRRRMAKEQARWRDLGAGRVVEQILPVLDNLERAVDAAGDDSAPENLRQGVELILRQFHDALGATGLEGISPENQPFDPRYHEAVARVEEGDHHLDTVVEVFQKGYLYKGIVLRPAMVKVAVGTGVEEETPLPREDAAGEN